VLLLACLNHLVRQGLEGTVVGSLIMPYFSGASNVLFVVAMARQHGPGRDVLVSALVNNTTNLTLLIGVPALLWGLEIMPAAKLPKRALRERRLSRLALALTLLALLTFTGVTWTLGADGTLSRADGLALIGLFLFWQLVEVVNVLRTSVEKGRHLGPMLLLDLLGICLGGVVLFVSIEGLIQWLAQVEAGFVNYRNVGWLAGWLMVLPNAIPAFYYAARGRADIVYSSQVGDGHICIPFCVGLCALISPVAVPLFFPAAMGLIVGLGLLHLGVVTIVGRAGRVTGLILIVVYAAFVRYGLTCS
jgi:cation:H+ antiporter